MVFEQFLQSDKLRKHAYNILALGIFYVIVAYISSIYFFRDDISVAMLFTVTLLLVPSIYVILDGEEKIESKAGTKNFFENHKDIFKTYLFLILGIFFAYILVSNFAEVSIFDYQLGFLENRGDLTAEVVSEFKESDYTPGVVDFGALISHNLAVIIIAFILSIFYGAGGLFLIVLNASVFAAFITFVIKQVGNAFQLISIFLIHLIPEMAGFLIAAIAGGVVSRAIMSEKFGSDGFRNVMKDALILLLISASLIVIAAFLELFVTAPLIKMVI